MSLENKICILDRLAKGERATKLATEFGIGNATVTDLKKNEAKIPSFVLSMDRLSVFSKQHKTMCLAEDEEVDKPLHLVYSKKESRCTSYWANPTGKSSNVLPKTFK